jgi:DNA-binding MarR family transcriptional regulator
MLIPKDKSIGSSSVRLSKKIARTVNMYLKPYQITTEQWSVLRTLHETDDISQKELSERADKDKATLTKILDLLEKQKLIQRVPNPSDRRSFLISITSRGDELAVELIPFLALVFEKITKDIDDDQMNIYQAVMKSIEDNIDTLLKDSYN